MSILPWGDFSGDLWAQCHLPCTALRDKGVKLRAHLLVGPSSCRLSEPWAFEHLKLRLSAGCTLALLVRAGEHDWAEPCDIVTRLERFDNKCCPCAAASRYKKVSISFRVCHASFSFFHVSCACEKRISISTQITTSTTMDTTTTISPTGKVSVDPSILKCT